MRGLCLFLRLVLIIISLIKYLMRMNFWFKDLICVLHLLSSADDEAYDLTKLLIKKQMQAMIVSVIKVSSS